MSEIVIIPEKKGIKKNCHRCGHDWIYAGQNPFFCSCPRCRTTVTITNKKRKIFLENTSSSSSFESEVKK